ncbi:MAG: cation-translocating P-type ATPase [Armatimonadetes bacterium]|nr:cation-translocating P-type ATPase [Armatimonadota bacterium]
MKELFKENKFRIITAILFLVVAPLEILSLFSIHFPFWVEFPFVIVIVLFLGKDVFISGIQGLFKLDFSNINLLMTIAVTGAFYLQKFDEAVIIIVLFALGDTLEEFGIRKSQRALEKLIESTPKLAEVKGKGEKIPLEKISPGEIIIIKPGNQIPLDGEVIKGESLIDESSITGEAFPKDKCVGSLVYAGTINTYGYLEIKVNKIAKDTTLSKIIDLTYKAAQSKSKSQKFIEKFAKIYTPSVVFISCLLFIIPVFFLSGNFNFWFNQALTLLIISCPCALVISTPVAVFSAIGNATEKGILIKGGRFIEEMGKIKAIAFDKTRTLTKGELIVSDVIPFNNFTEDEVIACAAGMELFSEHPIAKSILLKAKEKKISPHLCKDFQALSGKGLKGECVVCFNTHHCLGNIKFFAEEHYVEEAIFKKVEEFEKQGKTTVVIGNDKEIKGLIVISDEIREESQALIDNLLKIKIVPIILSGDNQFSSEFVAQKLGIKIVKAGLLPDEKVEQLLEFMRKYKYVAMAGDGINDAPALATSTVGIALGAIGSDIAVENADVALMNNNLNIIPYFINLSRKCLKKIKFNIALALLIKFSFLILALIGWSNLVSAIFADVGTTVLVILNSLSLYNYK